MFNQDKIAEANGASATVGLKQWLLMDCIMFLNIIPIIGSIAALVIYLVIAFGSNTAPSMKYRIIASLIWCVVSIVVLIFLFAFGLLSMASLGNR